MPSLTGKVIPPDPGIIFMGTPQFAIPSLASLINHQFRILAVVTQPDRPKGRGRKLSPPPVKMLGLSNSLEVYQPIMTSAEDFLNILKAKGPDLIIVVAFGQILNKELLNIPRYGVINIHASLLPKYRGAAPIQWAILNNEKYTGLTIMRMDEGLDTGPILYQKRIPIKEDETAGELHDRLAELAGDFLIESLKRMAVESIKEIQQDRKMASYAPKINKSIAEIEWGESSIRISCKMRAFDPWPGAFTAIGGKFVKMFRPKIVKRGLKNTIPGKIDQAEEFLRVETGDGIIEVGELQVPGRNRMPADDFLRGFTVKQGTIIGVR